MCTQQQPSGHPVIQKEGMLGDAGERECLKDDKGKFGENLARVFDCD